MEWISLATLGLTVILVVITGVYAWLTWKIANATERSVKASEGSISVMREQIEATYRPYITVTHRLTSNALLNLRICNTGNTNAENLRLEIDRDFYQLGTNENYNLAKLHAFTNSIESFPPGAELTFSLGPGIILHGKNNDEEKQPLVFRITSTYSFLGKTVRETTTVDLRPYTYTFTNPDPIEKQIRELTDVLKKLKAAIDNAIDDSRDAV